MIWLLIMISKALIWIYSLFIWPIAFLNRKAVRDAYYNGNWFWKALAFPMWITLDDEYLFEEGTDWDYGEPWWILQKGGKKNFLNAWLWQYARNNSWNWNNIVKISTGPEIVLHGWATDGYSPLLHRRFKWEYKTTDGWYGDWNTNQGDRLSEERTWLGTAFCIYGLIYNVVHENQTLTSGYWRFSHAGIHGPIMLNIKLGYNDRGEALFDFKIMMFKKKYTEHWK